MGLQPIEAGPRYGSPVSLVDQDTGDMTIAHWASSHGVSLQKVGASIALSPAHWLPESKTVESSRGKSTVVARASVAVAACVGLFVGAAWDNALCGESDTRAEGFVATEKGHKTAQANARWDESLPVSRVAETTVVEQKQILERSREREKVDILAGRMPPTQPLDAPQGRAAQAPQSAEAAVWERKQALEHEQEWDRADALARALTSSLREELGAVRSAAEAARSKQKQSLDQERGRAHALGREVTSARAELDAARIAAPEVAQAAEAGIKQRQALEQARNQERGRADALVRELTSVRADLDTARAAGLETVQTAEAAKIEQTQAFGRERDKTETLARDLTSAWKEAEERSARLAAAHAEVLQVAETNRALEAEQKLALASERDHADALARELTSVRSELEAGNRQIAALNALRALHSGESAVDRSQERMAESSSRAAEGK